jgi:hypothetical protein
LSERRTFPLCSPRPAGPSLGLPQPGLVPGLFLRGPPASAAARHPVRPHPVRSAAAGRTACIVPARPSALPKERPGPWPGRHPSFTQRKCQAPTGRAGSTLAESRRSGCALNATVGPVVADRSAVAPTRNGRSARQRRCAPGCRPKRPAPRPLLCRHLQDGSLNRTRLSKSPETTNFQAPLPSQ